MKGNGLPLVSVILGTYNARKFIPDTLRSILSQDYRHIELVVIDDASRDGTWEYLMSLKDSRLRIFRSRENLGIPATRNRGLRLAQGSYLTFFDHDDLMLPGAIRKRVEYLKAHIKPGGVFGLTKGAIDHEGSFLNRNFFKKELFDTHWHNQKFFLRYKTVDLEMMKLLFFSNPASLTNLLVRRPVVRKAGFFDVSLKLTDDLEYLFKLVKVKPLDFIDVPVKHYRVHNQNHSGPGSGYVFFRERRIIARRYGCGLTSRLAPVLPRQKNSIKLPTRISLVSVIMVTHNGQDFIRETAESILCQDYPYLELLVIDDASKDQTCPILESLDDPRVRLFRTKKIRGTLASRNRGLKLARGRYVTFVDQEESLSPGALRNRLKFLMKRTKIAP